jgi:hypothetical protein
MIASVVRFRLFACLSALTVVTTPLLALRQAGVPPIALADARAALGGDVALNAVTSVVATGSLTRSIAPGGVCWPRSC